MVAIGLAMLILATVGIGGAFSLSRQFLELACGWHDQKWINAGAAGGVLFLVLTIGAIAVVRGNRKDAELEDWLNSDAAISKEHQGDLSDPPFEEQ